MFICREHGIIKNKFCFDCGLITKELSLMIPEKKVSPSSETQIIDMRLYLDN